jgi:hypothetical protein
MSRSLLILCALTALALTSTLASDGQNQNSNSPPQLVPIQRRGGQNHQQVSPVPNPDPNGSTVRRIYPQPPGQPPVTDACFIQYRPPAGCMYPYVAYAGTPCGCTDGTNDYAGQFLLY